MLGAEPMANVFFGSGIRFQRAPGSGLECAAEPTLAVVVLLHLKRTAAISAVEGHLIERVNGGLGPPSTLRMLLNLADAAVHLSAAWSPFETMILCRYRNIIETRR